MVDHLATLLKEKRRGKKDLTLKIGNSRILPLPPPQFKDRQYYWARMDKTTQLGH